MSIQDAFKIKNMETRVEKLLAEAIELADMGGMRLSTRAIAERLYDSEPEIMAELQRPWMVDRLILKKIYAHAHKLADPEPDKKDAVNEPGKTSPLVDALQRVVEWWLREGINHFHGAPECIFRARKVLADRGCDVKSVSGPGELWPKIIQSSPSAWALWMSPLSEARYFATEEAAKAYVQQFARRMNDYVPPAKKSWTDSEVEREMYPSPSTPAWRVGKRIHLNVYEGDRPVCQCHSAKDALDICFVMNRYLQGSRVSEPSPETSSTNNKCLHVFTEVAGGACVKCGMHWADWGREPSPETSSTTKKDDYRELLESARAYVEAGAGDPSGKEWDRFYKAVGAMGQ